MKFLLPPGVVLEDGRIIASRGSVSGNVEPQMIVFGIRARLIRRLGLTHDLRLTDVQVASQSGRPQLAFGSVF
jgi:hypothetical protein